MMWEKVYQSERCCEFSELSDHAVPQLDVAALADRHPSHPEQDGGGRGDEQGREKEVGPDRPKRDRASKLAGRDEPPGLRLSAVGCDPQRRFDPGRLDRPVEHRAVVYGDRRGGDLRLDPRRLVNPHALQGDDPADERALEVDRPRRGVAVDASALFERDVVAAGEDFALDVARD